MSDFFVLGLVKNLQYQHKQISGNYISEKTYFCIQTSIQTVADCPLCHAFVYGCQYGWVVACPGHLSEHGLICTVQQNLVPAR